MRIKKTKNRSLKSRKIELKKFRDEGLYEFWLAQGCNYLNSNYEEAEWNPIFMGIYENETTISREDIVFKVNSYLSSLEDLEIRHNVLAAWAVQQENTVFDFYSEAKKSLKTDLFSSRNLKVWEAFYNMIEASRKFLKSNEIQE